MKNRITLFVFSSLFAITAVAQEPLQSGKIAISGSVQSDNLIPIGEQDDGSKDPFRTNTFVDVNLTSKYVDAGVRGAYLQHPLPGFEKDFRGWGLAHAYLKGKYKWAELTLGNYYEQFGSGFVLRTYEERSLGIDNPLLGGRLVLKPVAGVQIKAVSGKQKRYWEYNKAWINGGDVEWSLDQTFKGLAEKNIGITVGASWVNKYEKAEDDKIFVGTTHILRLPDYVNTMGARLNFRTSNINVLAEYAHKTQDPSFDNNWIYREGDVAMLSASYSQRGLSFLAQAKRSDNFSFRSRRSVNGVSSFLNHLPAFTMDQTYALAAMYPYATHAQGEWAYQLQAGYLFKKKTLLGGKYGTSVKVNFSYVRAIDQQSMEKDGEIAGTDGYKSDFWKWGNETYYRDINIQLDKRVSRDIRLHLMYMNQYYNKSIVEGKGGIVHSNIYIADVLFNLSKSARLRTELQYLATRDDHGDWLFGLAELSFAPHWMFTVSDQYNSGETKEHYYQALVTYNIKSHRIQGGYGRTRAGYNCSGGVCRYVPETKGFTLSYNYNF